MCVFAATGLLFSLSTKPVISLIILVAIGTFWLLSLNPTNTANQLLLRVENPIAPAWLSVQVQPS